MRERKLKLLIVSQYFWPENMRINDLAEGLVQRGHTVTVLTGWPNYPEGHLFEEFCRSPTDYTKYRGADIIRVPLIPRGRFRVTLMLNYLSFFLSASVWGSWKLRGREFDAVFVYAVSPIMAAVPALLIGKLKRTPVFIWVLDLWPETLRAVGVLSNPWLLALVGKGVSWIYNRADYLLLQSQAFSSSVRKYCTRLMPPERLVYFPSWAEDGFSDLSTERATLIEPDAQCFTILFAGNLGEAQDFPAILDVAQSLRGKLSIRWVIVGDGRMSEWLKQQVASRGLDNVFLLGRHPLEAMPPLFGIADALLVSLKTNEVFEKTIPGKVQAYLASGKPILAMLDGEAARVIQAAEAGFACAAGNCQAFSEIVKQMAAMSPLQREAMGISGKRYYDEHFSKAKLFSRLESMFHQATLRGKN